MTEAKMIEYAASYRQVTGKLDDRAVSLNAIFGILDGIQEDIEDGDGYNYDKWKEAVNELSSVTPQKGHWIHTNEFFINQDGQFIYKFICSECKSLSYFRKSNKKAIGANVCPNCGVGMESEEI